MLVVGAGLGLLESRILDVVYLIGAVGYILYWFTQTGQTETLRLRRLARMNILAGVLFALSAVARMGLLDRYGAQLWVLAMTIGVIFMLYAHLVALFGTHKDKDNE